MWNEILETTGTAQSERLLQALRKGYVRIDDRELHDLLAFVAAFSREVNHYDATNNISGNWEAFFMKDVSVVLAVILNTDIDSLDATSQHLVSQIQQIFQPDSKQYQKGQKFRLLISYCEHLLKLPKMVDEWFHWLAGTLFRTSGLESQVVEEIRQSIRQHFQISLHLLQSYDIGSGKPEGLGEPLGLDFSPFGKVWDLREEPDAINIFVGESLNEKIDYALVYLRLIYQSLFEALTYLIYQLKRYFSRSLSEKQDHEPHIGLLIAFLSLFKHAQNDLNAFLTRHQQYYYQDILGQHKRPADPDRIFVKVDLARHIEKYRLPAGTQLFAGRAENGNPILFETEDAANLNHANIAALKTLYISRNPGKFTAQHEIVTDIYASPVANSSDGEGGEFTDHVRDWSLFGEDQEKRRKRTMPNGALGFGISSPVLFLHEGKREVRLDFFFDASSSEDFKTLLRGLNIEEGETDLREAFLTVFPESDTKSLRLFGTGPDDWFEIPSRAIRIVGPTNWEEDVFSFQMIFTLSASDPALVAYSSRIHQGEGSFGGKAPVLKVILRDTQPYVYSFLCSLQLREIQLRAKVDKVRNLTLFNDMGRLDPAQPFPLFGPQPAQGTYLLVGNTEIFRKQLVDLRIRLDWHNLPQPQTISGFVDHYAHYGEAYDFHPERFYVRVSALSNNEFFPREEDGGGVEVPLFQPIENAYAGYGGDYQINRTELRNLDISQFNLSPDPHLSSVDQYDNNQTAGFIRLELSAPTYAFGHQDYSRVFTSIATSNATRQGEGEIHDPYPGSPYTPMLKAISLSYEAEGRIYPQESGRDATEGQLFHIHPFGVLNLNRQNRHKSGSGVITNLLPQYAADGYLFIGLKDLKPPQELSLLFQLSSRSAQSNSQQELPELEWHYLEKDQWVPFQNTQHLWDSTDSFTKSGIVRIQIPAQITNRNNLMPAGFFWLKIAAKGDLHVMCHAYEVHAQGVAARWVNTGGDHRLDVPLPANSIQGLARKQAEILAVSQPFPSFGGRRSEDEGMFVQRVSERLSHKQRVITNRDYERIVLDQFPEIFQVRCLSHQSHPNEITQLGDVVLTVVPTRKAYSQEGFELLTPRLNYKTLQSIETYIQRHASPFVRLKVRNPDYEFLRVSCKVKFVDNQNNGYNLERLKEDLKGIICPWAFQKDAPLGIGKSLHEGTVLSAIKALPYVRFVTRFSIIHIFLEDEEKGIFKFLETARETESLLIQPRPWAVLIPDVDHEIDITEREDEEIAKVRPENKPIRFFNHIDIFKSGQTERHTTRKIRPQSNKRQAKAGGKDTLHHITIKL